MAPRATRIGASRRTSWQLLCGSGLALVQACGLTLCPRAAAAQTLSGTLAQSETWNAAGSPYVVTGDLTIAPGASLSIEPGVDVQFARQDALGTGTDPGRIELIVQGALHIDGTAEAPIRLRTQSENYANSWYGVIVEEGASAVSLHHAQVENANIALRCLAPADVLSVSDSVFRNNFTGISLNQGHVSFERMLFDSNAVDGVFAEANAHSVSLSVSNSVFVSNGSHGVYATATVGNSHDVSVTNCTFFDNISSGLASRAFGAGTHAKVAIENSIFIMQGIFGIDAGVFDDATSDVSATFTDFYGNGTDYTTAVTPGAGCIEQPAHFIGAPSDLRLSAGSACIDAGSKVGAPSADMLGRERPQGAGIDLGAYEYMDGDGPAAAGGGGASGADAQAESSGAPSSGWARVPTAAAAGAGAQGSASGAAADVASEGGVASAGAPGAADDEASGGALDAARAAAGEDGGGCSCRLGRHGLLDVGAVGAALLLVGVIVLRRRRPTQR